MGRDKEIKQLMRCFDSALNGKGTAVFISGEAGIGKTRLVNEFLSIVKMRETNVLCGSCLSGATIPYFPFTEAFNSYLSTIDDGKTKAVLTKHLGITGWLRGPKPLKSDAREHLGITSWLRGPKPLKSDAREHLGITSWLRGPEITRESIARELVSTPKTVRDRTFEATATALLQLSTHEPAILFLDDLHWADHLSLALIQYVARRCQNSQLLIIGTYRSEELVRTKEGALHPLEETMFSMSREDLLTKMELSRLKHDDFPTLLRSMFRSQFNEEFVDKLFTETQGNPLFVLETLKLLAEEGFLSEKGGQWMLVAPVEKVGVPSKVHEVIIRRISRLERDQRRLLDRAAVCACARGHSFNPDTLRRTMAADKVDVLEKLVDIEQRHRLIRAVNSTFEFTHEKIREVIYDNLPGELRSAYHLETARCLEQIPAEHISDDYLADIAFHYVKGGALANAFDYLIRLGEKAVQISADAQAIDYLDKALEATRTTARLASHENLARIYRIRGRAWMGRGEVGKAFGDFKLLLQNATSLGDESVLAESHYWLGEALITQNIWDKSKQSLLNAIELARKTGNKLVECRSLAALADTLLWHLNTLEESRTRFEEASKISRMISDRVAEARSRFGLGFFYNWRGEFNLAKENVKEALMLFEELGDRFHVLETLQLLGWVHCGKGEYNDAVLALHRCLQLAQKWDIVYWDRAPMPLTLLGWIYRDLSNTERALQYDSEALENARACKHTRRKKCGTTVAALVDLGMDYLHRNDYENAEKQFTEATPLLSSHRLGVWRIEIRQLLGFAEIALAKGDFQNAQKSVEDSLALSVEAGAKKYIAIGLKLKAELFAEIGRNDEAIGLMEKALESAQHVGNPPVLWQTHYSFGLVLEKRGDFQEAHEHYAEAIALIAATASELNDPSLKDSLLSAPLTNAIRDAYVQTRRTS